MAPYRAMSRIRFQRVGAVGALVLSLAALSSISGELHATDGKVFGAPAFESRLKAFGQSSYVPDSDVQRLSVGSPALDMALDARVMYQQNLGNAALSVDYSLAWLVGDGIALGNLSGGDGEFAIATDGSRALTLTDYFDEGSRHVALHRLDRANLQWRSGKWSLTIGRQAVSWGSGIVFQPLDPFNPFAPTAVDRDYKPGDDLVLVERSLPGGHDLQLLHVVRRDEIGDRSQSAASTAAKWHGYVQELEFELIAAEHYGNPFFAVSAHYPIGPAVVRADVAARRGIAESKAALVGAEEIAHLAREDEWGTLAVVNIDVAFPIANRLAYVFAEYFHNDFGLDELPVSSSDLASSVTPDLQAGLSRGEFFNLMQDYLAVGASYQWHPLLNQSLSLITNLHDRSHLIQAQVTFDAAQNQSLQVGWIGSFGGRGDEFGEFDLAEGADGEAMTSGGGQRVYVRWAAYF